MVSSMNLESRLRASFKTMVFHLNCIPGVCPAYLISKENVMKALTTLIVLGLRGSGKSRETTNVCVGK